MRYSRSSYNPSPAIVELSRDELQIITRLISGQLNRERPATVLIGGWAVDAYNPYYGSQDIDFVTDDTTRKILIAHLKENGGYEDQIHYPFDTVKKATPHGEIILDLASWEAQSPFEGYPAIPFTYEILIGNTVLRKVGRGGEIPIPNRSTLLFCNYSAPFSRTKPADRNTKSTSITIDGSQPGRVTGIMPDKSGSRS
ncbi:hypothetical protein [Methanoregula sp.]|uniref:hypothetical protein n=1 Tax=Methanoregula sp. TaxID=2052170 RepID=UPI0025E9A40C|nr:hypothetical protein [Methanoregula sp.]